MNDIIQELRMDYKITYIYQHVKGICYAGVCLQIIDLHLSAKSCFIRNAIMKFNNGMIWVQWIIIYYLVACIDNYKIQ